MKRYITLMFLILFCAINLFAQSPVKIVKAEIFSGPSAGDYSVYDIGSKFFAGMNGSLNFTLSQNVFTQVDLLAGKYMSGDNLLIGAMRLYYRNNSFAIGISYQHDKLGELTSDLFSAGGELYRGDLLSVTLNGGYEIKSFGEDIKFAELFLNTYINPHFLLSSGVSYAVTVIKQTRADIILKGEYIFFNNDTATPAVYLQYGGNNITKLSFGINFYFGKSNTLKERHDVLGFYSMRYK